MVSCNARMPPVPDSNQTHATALLRSRLLSPPETELLLSIESSCCNGEQNL